MTSINKNLTLKQVLINILSSLFSLSTPMVYLPPSRAIVVGTNRTNATPTISLLFIFLCKTNIILGDSAMRRPSGTVSTYSGSLLCNLYVRGRGGSTNLLGVLNLPRQGLKKNHKNWKTCRHCRTSGERVSYLRGSWNWNKRYTSKKINFVCGGVLYQMNKGIETSKNSQVHMIWADRRDHLEGGTTPLAGMPSSSVGYLRSLLLWCSIQRPA